MTTFLRLDIPLFDGLIQIVGRTVAKRSTKMWEAATVHQRAAIPLRCLATGSNFEGL
jgi:hypothetical protein